MSEKIKQVIKLESGKNSEDSKIKVYANEINDLLEGLIKLPEIEENAKFTEFKLEIEKTYQDFLNNK